MRYNLEITQDNLEELNAEKKILLNIDNLFNGKKAIKSQENSGTINYKFENFQGYNIVEWDSIFNQNVKINGQISDPIFALHFMIEGDSEYVVGSKKTRIAGGKNNVWSLNSGGHGYSGFKKNIYCASFGIILNSPFLIELTNRYPDLLGNIYRKFENGETFYLNENHLSTSCQMKHILWQLKNSQLMGKMSHIYSEAKIMELIALQLQQEQSHTRTIHQKHCKRKCDIEKIHEAKNILLSNLDNPPSIRELSLQIGINDKKLKYGFKEVFNQTVYGCLFDYKMERARNLLLNTDKTVVEIACECGYEYASHFTTAFKRKFGISPKQYKSTN